MIHLQHFIQTQETQRLKKPRFTTKNQKTSFENKKEIPKNKTQSDVLKIDKYINI